MAAGLQKALAFAPARFPTPTLVGATLASSIAGKAQHPFSRLLSCALLSDNLELGWGGCMILATNAVSDRAATK